MRGDNQRHRTDAVTDDPGISNDSGRRRGGHAAHVWVAVHTRIEVKPLAESFTVQAVE